MDTKVVAAAGAFLLWLLVSIGYLEALRGLLTRRERSLRIAVGELAAALRSWQAGLSEMSLRERRESAAAMGQVVAELESVGPLADKLVTLDEVRLFVEEGEELVSGARGVPGEGMNERVRRVRRALERVRVDLARYNAGASDAAFARERIPLSLLAAAVGLRARPFLVEREKG